MTTEDRDPVDVLAEEFADRLRQGEHPSVGDYAAAHPDHADQLRDLLPAVAQMELLKRFRLPPAAGVLPDRLGDFRIVRELGRGGMGVVFEAVQESLGRSVALKVLARHAQLDATRRERFVREAQAAAKLHHTNIVPVFGVGEHDGLPYYVMQLIPGGGVNAVVWQWRKEKGLSGDSDREMQALRPDTKPTHESQAAAYELHASAPKYGDWRFIAAVGLQTAAALDYAHKQGVLHRDVKPANLILDGETVWVTDFGLAKLMDTDGLTATGDILGTLQYLPPECLTGRADPRSDVYGLGATLYELLTLEPPHTADSPARLIKQVADTDPRPPRERNPAIPRDLETIVMTAMAREPAARYATARDLAADLQAFLDDRPIKARRTTLAARGWRWCRRNPAVASLALSTLIAVSLAAVAGWVGYARTTAALAREADRRADAERATADAQQMATKLEANLRLSLDTFEKVFEAAGGRNRFEYGFPPPPDRGPKRGPPDRGPPGHGGPAADAASDQAAVLEAVLAFYDKFAEQNAPTPQLQLEAAKASRRVGEAHSWLKCPDKAAVALRRAVVLLEPLVTQFPDNEPMRVELILTYRALARASGTLGDTAGAEQADRSANQHAERFGGRPFDVPWPGRPRGGKKDGPAAVGAIWLTRRPGWAARTSRPSRSAVAASSCPLPASDTALPGRPGTARSGCRRLPPSCRR